MTKRKSAAMGPKKGNAKTASRAPAEARTPKPVTGDPGKPPADPEARRRMIEERAYYLAQQRDFTPGYEMEDWLAAEREVDKGLGQT
jgi:hypothetical protein